MKAEERAKTLLKTSGILVYDPGEYAGECKAPYAVVHRSGRYPTIHGRRLCYYLLTVSCYVPVGREDTAKLDALAEKVKGCMRKMVAQAKPTGNESPDAIKSQYKALARGIEYIVLNAQKE